MDFHAQAKHIPTPGSILESKGMRANSQKKGKKRKTNVKKGGKL